MWRTDFKDSAATSLSLPRHFQSSVLVKIMECMHEVIRDMWRCIRLLPLRGPSLLAFVSQVFSRHNVWSGILLF